VLPVNSYPQTQGLHISSTPKHGI